MKIIKQTTFLISILIFLCHQLVAQNGIEGLKSTSIEEHLKSFGNQEDTTIYFIVEEMPLFPGGDEGLRDTISKYYFYPEEAIEDGPEGRVYVNFVIEKDGSINYIRIARGVHPILDSAAIKIVESLPVWTPGYQDGEAKRVSYTIPVNFVLPVVSASSFANTGFEIYPNPSKDFVYISVPTFKSFNYSVIDVNGKVIKTGKSAQALTKIAISNLKKGIYFVQIRNNEVVLSKSFIVY